MNISYWSSLDPSVIDFTMSFLLVIVKDFKCKIKPRFKYPINAITVERNETISMVFPEIIKSSIDEVEIYINRKEIDAFFDYDQDNMYITA